jgi:predicted secreted protein
MASNAFAGVGTTFTRNAVVMAEINSISGFNKSRDTIDVTTLDSTGGYREFIGGFRDGGEISLNMNYTRASYDLLNADFESSSSQSYTIVLTDTNATEYAFSGWVTNITLDVPLDDKVTMAATIKIDGQITQTS